MEKKDYRETKGKLPETLSNCRIKELNLDADKFYTVAVEVDGLDNDEIVIAIKQVKDVFDKVSYATNCIFIPVRKGRPLFKVNEISEYSFNQVADLLL